MEAKFTVISIRQAINQDQIQTYLSELQLMLKVSLDRPHVKEKSEKSITTQDPRCSKAGYGFRIIPYHIDRLKSRMTRQKGI